MNTNRNNELLAYKYRVAKLKARNQAVDPLDLFKDLPPIQSYDLPINNTPNEEQQQSIPTPTGIREIYNNQADELFRQNIQAGIDIAKTDKTGSFQNYYLPISLIEQSYKPYGTRADYLGEPDYITKEYEGDELVYYKDRHKNKNYIALKGTNSIDNLISDLNIALLNNTDTIMRDVDNDFLKIIRKYPDEKFIIAGHSLGGTRAHILLNQFDNKIERGIGFNTGQSPNYLVGWKPEVNDKFIQYHINNDFISKPDKTQGHNVLYLTKAGRPSVGIADRINKYHKLGNFKDWFITNYIEANIDNFDELFDKSKREKPRYNTDTLKEVMKRTGAKKSNLRRGDVADILGQTQILDNIKSLSEIELETLLRDRYNVDTTGMSKNEMIFSLARLK